MIFTIPARVRCTGSESLKPRPYCYSSLDISMILLYNIIKILVLPSFHIFTASSKS